MQDFDSKSRDNSNQLSSEVLARHLASLRAGELLFGPDKTRDALEIVIGQLKGEIQKNSLLEIKDIYETEGYSAEVRLCCLSLLSQWCGAVPELCSVVISAISESLEQEVSLLDVFSQPAVRYLDTNAPEIINFLVHRMIASAQSPRLADSLLQGILLKNLVTHSTTNVDGNSLHQIEPISHINNYLLHSLRQFDGLATALSSLEDSFAKRAESLDDVATFAARAAGILKRTLLADSQEIEELIHELESMCWDLENEHEQKIMSSSSIVEIVRILKDAPNPEEYLLGEFASKKNSVVFLGLDVYSDDQAIKVAEYACELVRSGAIGAIALPLPGDIAVIREWISKPLESKLYPYDLGGREIDLNSEAGLYFNAKLYLLLTALKPVFASVILFDEERYRSTEVGILDTERSLNSFVSKTSCNLSKGVLVIGDLVTGNLWEVGTIFAKNYPFVASSRVIVTMVSPEDNTDPFEVIGEACQRISRVEPFGITITDTALEDLPYREFNKNLQGRLVLGAAWEGVVAFPCLDDDGDFDANPMNEVDEPIFKR
jgi:hypothetical protein